MRQDKEIIKEIALRAFKCINIYILLIQKYGQETNNDIIYDKRNVLRV